jgi:dihydrofolate reductase
MKLTLTQFVTLDGVMQAPGTPTEDPSGGFDHGGWIYPYPDGGFNDTIVGAFAEADAFLLGRRTYEIFASYWPTKTDAADPIAGPLNRLPKYVASRTLKRVDWDGSELLRGDVVEAVRELKARPGRELQVHGSAGLIQTLIANDLIDLYRLMIFPLTLGSGRRLFAEGTRPAALKLVSSLASDNGITINLYEPAGEPQYGNMDA